MPVTTLGLIDTAIGGKGGVDLPGVGRNLLGAIHQPTATILDVALVADEPRRGPAGALAEAVKYGLLGDDALLALLESRARPGARVRGPAASELLELVERCALAKRRLVLVDEHDTSGVRMALNLGHTISHALEAATGYRIRHGEAVAYGLRAALEIGVSMRSRRRRSRPGRHASSTASSWRPSPSTCRLDEILSYVEGDKKRRGGRTRWVLVGSDAVTIRDDVPASVVEAAVASLHGRIAGRR